MAFDDATPRFREILNSKRARTSLRTKHAKHEPSPADVEAAKHGLPTLKVYMQEAYAVLTHINNMTRMLTAVRRPYLNLDSHARPSSARKLNLSSPDAWSGIKHLSNDERDQIDLHARVVLSKCADRVKEMERIEKRRAEVVSRKGTGVLRLLPSRLLPHDALAAQSDFIASHNASVTWYLNRRLAEASAGQKDMQEERVKRQMERARTLGSGAARDAAMLGMDVPGAAQRALSRNNTVPSSPASTSSWMPGSSAGSSLASSIASLTGSSPLSSSGETARPSFAQSPLASADNVYTSSDDDLMGSDDAELELSQSQILQFENENASILRNVQDTLASVQRAESSLLDISALQMELVAHLTQQTEITDKLFEDAIATSETVDAGNRQLIEARKRQSDSRVFMLVFLLGASFGLLFLHYY
ncbi:hypothetical protein EXIGLDRAFT_743691 [Exidia glandulosa HHB12029]|uniref:t-SNARE coiled-coil homology domain-containing protein n=1 Tax=Exidia glandulosa HHB12029 TaxID=1314781 RepID=A0A165QUR0_EXIGL|nr:hypothetical protein EXIGLDRAFT_743691 [Exidia glandulosa HHB12029]